MAIFPHSFAKRDRRWIIFELIWLNFGFYHFDSAMKFPSNSSYL